VCRELHVLTVLRVPQIYGSVGGEQTTRSNARGRLARLGHVAQQLFTHPESIRPPPDVVSAFKKTDSRRHSQRPPKTRPAAMPCQNGSCTGLPSTLSPSTTRRCRAEDTPRTRTSLWPTCAPGYVTGPSSVVYACERREQCPWLSTARLWHRSLAMEHSRARRHGSAVPPRQTAGSSASVAPER